MHKVINITYETDIEFMQQLEEHADTIHNNTLYGIDEAFNTDDDNAFIAFLLAIINYLKLDATSEAHKISSHQYDKLQSYVEFQSGQILLFSDPLLSKQSLQKHIDELSILYKNDILRHHVFPE